MALPRVTRGPDHSATYPPPPSPALLPWSGQLRLGKPRVPTLPVDAVPRPRLLRRIEDEGRPLVLIVAPAGFGKTTFAAQWAAYGPATAWLSVDQRDALLDRFWAHLRDDLLCTASETEAFVAHVGSTRPHSPG